MKAGLKSKLVLMSVAASVSGALLAGAIGCDAVENAESRASRQVNQASDEAMRALGSGDANAAARSLSGIDQSASASARARAHALLAQADFDRAQPLLEELDAAQVRAATLAWEIDQLLLRMRDAASTARNLQHLDPKPVRDQAAQSIRGIQGDANTPVWVKGPDDSADVPTLSQVNQRISQLEGEIAKRKERISQLAEQRKKINAEAQELVEKSNQTPGQAGVDLFRQATQLRQQASLLGIQINSVNAELIPLNNDLSVAQAQREVLQQAVGRIEKQDQALSEAWKEIGQEIDGQDQLARAILQSVGGLPSEGQTDADRQQSIQAKLEALQKLIAESTTTQDQANQYLRDAAQNAASAAQQAQAAATQFQTRGNTLTQSRPAFQSLTKANDANAYRLKELTIRQTLANSLAGRAAVLAMAVDAQTRLQELAQQTKVPLPQGLIDPQLAAELAEARQATTDALTETLTLAETVKEAGGASPEQRNAARVASVIARYAWVTHARAAGDAATADAQLEQARQEVREAAENRAVFPPLPAELNIPAEAAAATPTNNSAPGGFMTPDAPDVE